MSSLASLKLGLAAVITQPPYWDKNMIVKILYAASITLAIVSAFGVIGSIAYEFYKTNHPMIAFLTLTVSGLVLCLILYAAYAED